MMHFRFVALIGLLWLSMAGKCISQTDTPPPPPVRDNTHDPADEFVVLDVLPSPINLNEIRQAIVYPQIARDNGIRGKVIFRVLIDENGNYVRHKVLRTPHPWLTAEVERHIAILRFTPAILNGQAIRTWVTVPFDFQLILPNDSTATNPLPPVPVPK